jgi:DNA-binding transcriptional ArsR family regulator
MLDATLRALADPHRRKIVEALSRSPSRAGDLARQMGVSPPTMSKHLRQLREAGLVEESHPDFDTRVRIYALRSAGLSALQDWLANTETMWVEQLGAFKRHIESE